MESNVTLIRNLIEDNKTYKHVSEILRQNFPEVTRGFSERNVRLFCAKYGAPNERYTDLFRGLYVPFLQSNFAVPNLIKTSKTHPRLPYKHLYGRLFLSGPGYLTEMARTRNIIIIASCIIGIFSDLRTWTRFYYGESSD